MSSLLLRLTTPLAFQEPNPVTTQLDPPGFPLSSSRSSLVPRPATSIFCRSWWAWSGARGAVAQAPLQVQLAPPASVLALKTVQVPRIPRSFGQPMSDFSPLCLLHSVLSLYVAYRNMRGE
eukprot:2034650-Rhodomonas_salina.2